MMRWDPTKYEDEMQRESDRNVIKWQETSKNCHQSLVDPYHRPINHWSESAIDLFFQSF